MNIPSLEDPPTATVRNAQAQEGAPVLLVEDEPDLAEEIRLELEANGYLVLLATTAGEALAAGRSGWASVFVFDRMLHGDDGLSAIGALRAEGVATPVLVISALSSVDERIKGLKAGGDDYLV